MEKFNRIYEEFMESKQEDFFVELSNLYSSKTKMEKVVDGINNKKYSYSRAKPILVSKLSKGKYFVIDGNHRVLEYANEGKSRVKVRLFDYKQTMNETDVEDEIVPVSEYVNKINREIDETRIPKTVPRYLYHATYKQMLPTINKDGGLKVGTFLRKTYKEAMNDAQMIENLDQDWKDNIIVFKINTGKLDKNKIEVDNNENPNEYMYNDVVPCGCLIRNG